MSPSPRRRWPPVAALALAGVAVAAGASAADALGAAATLADTAAAPVSDALELRGRVDLYAYLAWLWVVIGALVYVLYRRLREADRVHRMGFDAAGERLAPTSGRRPPIGESSP
ncbi:MAG: hypothetical protein ABIL09_05770 [Gemmatimonadota bacterium]